MGTALWVCTSMMALQFFGKQRGFFFITSPLLLCSWAINLVIVAGSTNDCWCNTTGNPFITGTVAENITTCASKHVVTGTGYEMLQITSPTATFCCSIPAIVRDTWSPANPLLVAVSSAKIPARVKKKPKITFFGEKKYRVELSTWLNDCWVRKLCVHEYEPLTTAVWFGGNNKTLSPTATIPVSMWPDTQKPDPVPLNMSLTEKRKGLLMGRSGHLKLSMTLSNVGPLYLKPHREIELQVFVKICFEFVGKIEKLRF